ncbi:nitroreductase family protein [Streptococcus ruminantium]|uniref:NADPH-dependent oxidoreductase n=2 Tax=Streptococcus ruminantium TaxID=1917441 RepID=A0A2Z5TPE3_9STRE|nr:nitroreductase family protein [Streptococcus ruminantium]MDQ8760142.1 nitroreductase family protein [Streptococcus ruminantium]MDQ8764463.1 nitroreductase family protein [Streptococcus ruminantium]MDQ8766802.1 nitroreductase family protein [Streptococcus ruminantium]MDQ8769430.1 nitroreductase family protein [Streptococcus ruminantium]MDQ8774935.1 nitroreductase family protein [Streptococcus ruminantium]
MNETIDLMLSHSSVRRFTEEAISKEHLDMIITAGRAASSWKNLQSYSIIVVQSETKKQSLYNLVPQPAILQAQAILVFVGDHNRASKAAQLHGANFDAKGTENLLISSVDASLAGQNALLAAESLGYGGVFIGMIRHKALDIAELFSLPDYTYPIFCIALGCPAQNHPVKPRLEADSIVFQEEYIEQGVKAIEAYDRVQTAYAGARQAQTWSERMVMQFGQAEQPETRAILEKNKLL